MKQYGLWKQEPSPLRLVEIVCEILYEKIKQLDDLVLIKVMVDDVEADEEGIVDVVLDDNAIRQVPRPGTSLRSAVTSSGGTSQAYRPTTQSGSY